MKILVKRHMNCREPSAILNVDSVANLVLYFLTRTYELSESARTENANPIWVTHAQLCNMGCSAIHWPAAFNQSELNTMAYMVHTFALAVRRWNSRLAKMLRR